MQLIAWSRAVASLCLGVLGQLMFRRFGMSQAPADWAAAADWSMDWLLAFSWSTWPAEFLWVLCGGLCYLIAVLLWVQVLQQLTLARAYPLLSLAYPLVYVGAVVWLGEPATVARTGGTLLVCVGVLLTVAPAPNVRASE